VLCLYWIFTLVTTTGYGDLYGTTKGEYIITVYLEFGGIIVFAMISFLVVKILEGDYTFSVCINEKFV
jgi:Ion channel